MRLAQREKQGRVLDRFDGVADTGVKRDQPSSRGIELLVAQKEPHVAVEHVDCRGAGRRMLVHCGTNADA